MTNPSDPATYYLDDLGASVGIAGPTGSSPGVTLTAYAGPVIVTVSLSATGAGEVANRLRTAAVTATAGIPDLDADSGSGNTQWDPPGDAF
jgi:hypothetical protein